MTLIQYNRGATTKFLGGPNLRPTFYNYKRSMAYNSQHWDWRQTEICVKFSKE